MKRQIIYSLVLVMVGGALGNWFRFAGTKPDREADLASIPLSLPGYQGREEFFDNNTYQVLNATSTTLKRYAGADGSRCDLFIAYFASQRFGAGIHSPRHCLPGGGWQIESQEPFMITFPDGVQRAVNRLHIALGTESSLMYYWYRTRYGEVRSEVGLKLDLFRSALSLRPTDAALVRVTIPVAGRDYATANREAVQFIQAAGPYIEQALPFGPTH